MYLPWLSHRITDLENGLVSKETLKIIPRTPRNIPGTPSLDHFAQSFIQSVFEHFMWSNVSQVHAIKVIF